MPEPIDDRTPPPKPGTQGAVPYLARRLGSWAFAESLALLLWVVGCLLIGLVAIAGIWLISIWD